MWILPSCLILSMLFVFEVETWYFFLLVYWLFNRILFGCRSEDSVSTVINGTEDSSSAARQVLELEREALELRRELQDTRAKKEESEKKLLQ